MPACIAVTGPAATATVQHLEVTGATVAKSSLPGFPTTIPSVLKITDAAKVRIENSWFHDFQNPVIDNSGNGELRIFDTLIENCFEAIHVTSSYADIERVHIRHLHGYSDFIDFDFDSTPHSIVRDCLMEDNIDGGGDGIDTSETNCLIENVIVKDVWTDKGLSLEGKSTPIIRNVLVVNCHSGLVSKDSCTAEFHNVTVVGSAIAVRCYQKNAGKGGGHGTAENLILWGNQKNFEIDSLSSFETNYSDVQGGAPGAGNIDLDPMFVDPNPAGGDFHLRAGSPAIGSGKAGTDMGCFPYTGPRPVRFIRGDANGDGALDISDPLLVLLYKFAGVASDCLAALDSDDSDTVEMTDAIIALGYLFRSGAPPAPPFPTAGEDPTAGSLDCQRH